MEFIDLSLLTGFSIISLMVLSIIRTRDTLSPAIIFGAMLIFQYVFYPIRFELTVPLPLREMLDDNQLIFAQSLFLVGATCIMVGLVAGTGIRRHGAPLFAAPVLNYRQRVAARKTMWVLAFISVGTSLYASITSGGLAVNVHTEFGHINEAYHFCVPATVFYLLSVSHRKLSWKDLIICVFLMSPMLIRGFLVAKRGPILIFALGLATIWFYAARRRPGLAALTVGGCATFMLVALLFFNRDAIWSGREIDPNIDPLALASINPGNDFIYGAAMANVAHQRNVHDYGVRFLITVFVRPVPSAVWPSKYIDASNFFGVGLYTTIGTFINESYLYLVSYPILGWQIAPGAYWGIVTDMFWEFRFFGVPLLFLMSYYFGRLYRKSGSSASKFLIVTVSLSVAPYIVAQDLGESGFRILFMTIPGAVLFKVFEGQRSRPKPRVALPAIRDRAAPTLMREV